MNSPTLLLWASLILGGGGGIVTLIRAIKDIFTDGPARRAEVSAKQAVSAKNSAEATARDHKTWFVEADEAYRRIDQECKQCKSELKECHEEIDTLNERFRGEFHELNQRFHRLLDGIDDLCQSSETLTVSIAELRTVARAARYAT